MKTAEAIETLRANYPDACFEQLREAVDAAIEALKAQLSQECTTSDTISRQAALEKVRAMQTYKLFMGDDMILVDKAEVQTELMMLPPAQPEPQEGYWIPHESPDGGEQYECSRCGVLWEFTDGTPEDNEAYFCPKCGKKLITK